MMYNSIVFHGQYASGKTEAATCLAHLLGWRHASFAAAVKELFCRMFDVDLSFVERWKRISEPPPGFILPIRQCLINIGDGFRQMQPNIWIDKLFNAQDHHYSIGDGRYVNESLVVRDRGGLSVLVWRPGFENDLPSDSEQQVMPYIRRLIAAGADDGKISPEMGIPFDLFLKNSGELPMLYAKVSRHVLSAALQKFNVK